MPHARRFRFAVELHEPLPESSLLDTFRELEALGYSTVFFPDHFDEGPGPIAAMTAAVMVTSTLNVGSLVFDCDYRHPAVLSRELATIDQISEGRLEVGLGAGWKRTDYDSAGIEMERPGIRVSRLIEHTAVLKGLWGDGPFSFAGEHYRITGLDGSPKLFRPGGPPVLVAGGAPRLLTWAGTIADIVGVNPSIHSGAIDQAAADDAMAERIDEKFGWLRDGAGDRFDDIELNCWVAVAEVVDDPNYGELIAPLFGTDAATLSQSPMALYGSVAEIAAKLHERRDRWGYSYIVVPGAKAREFAPVVAELAGELTVKIANANDRAVLVLGDRIVDVADASDGRFGPNLASVYDDWDAFVEFAGTVGEGTAPLVESDLRCPVPAPRQVFAIGLNYRQHAEESGRPLPGTPATFTKFPAALGGPFDDIEIVGDSVDWEVELVVVIGRRADRVAEADAWAHVAGLTIGQDISDRQLQFAAGGQFSLGKSRRGYGPMGPWVVTVDEFADPDDLALGCSLDGETVQDARTNDLVFSVPQLIAELSSVLPLLPGDVIFTGTPAGVGLARQPPRFLQPGQILETWIEGIGTMRNRCV